MTHLSDMSYLHRAVSTSWFYIWFLFYVSRWNRFEAFRLRRLQRYDIGSARIKYVEGFWTNPKTHEIQSKPAQAWTEQDILHVEPLYYTLACSLSLQNCAFFLLQAFWSYISKSVTKSSFMSSFEFKIYVVASCFAVALFPTVQYLFRNDFVYREVIPHLIFSILLFTTGALGLRVHFRLVALIKNAALTLNESTLDVLEKLEYFKDMNVILTFSVFACSFSLGIVAGDGISPNPKIAANKFASDLLITNLNFFQVIIWVTLTLIFYPRKSVVNETVGSYHNNSSGNPNNHHNNNNNHHIINSNQQRHKRGPSDNFRLARRNNEVHSEEEEYDLESGNTSNSNSNRRHIQNDSKAQLAQNEVLDPYWASREGARSPRHEQQQGRRHHRTFSGDSRYDTAITLTSLSPTRPSLTIVTSSAGTPDIAMHEAGMTSPSTTRLASPPPTSLRSPTSPTAAHIGTGSSKPERETRTLYYHEALAKAQQLQQQQDQANEYYNMTQADVNHASINNTNGNGNSGNASRPERSAHRPAPLTISPAALDRSTPPMDFQPRTSSAAGRNTPNPRGAGAMSPVGGARSPSSMDHRTPRDKIHHRRTSSATANNFNNNGNRILNPVPAHQEIDMRMKVDPRSISALGHAPQNHQSHRRQDSEESDMSVIQIAYVGSMSQAQQEHRYSQHQNQHQKPEQGQQQEPYTQGEFYDGLSSSALRPYSPR
ncbi:hypothetical protein EC991_002536 [Linnemannia zychae]|nr:hypothetical protein EC991_002536 [Linnemannia zychae]